MPIGDEEIWGKALALRERLETYKSEVTKLRAELQKEREQAAISGNREAWESYNTLISLLLTEEAHLAESSGALIHKLLEEAREPVPQLKRVK
jgi:hypothetical protein